MITEKERINVDFNTAEEIALLRESKAQAMRSGKRIREWVIEALRAQLARESPPKK